MINTRTISKYNHTIHTFKHIIFCKIIANLIQSYDLIIVKTSNLHKNDTWATFKRIAKLPKLPHSWSLSKSVYILTRSSELITTTNSTYIITLMTNQSFLVPNLITLTTKDSYNLKYDFIISLFNTKLTNNVQNQNIRVKALCPLNHLWVNGI